MINPLLKNRRHFVIYASIWILISGIQVLITFSTLKISIGTILPDIFFANTLFALFGLVIWYPVYFSNMDKNSWFSIIFTHMISCTITIFVWIQISRLIIEPFLKTENINNYMISSMSWRIGTGIFFYFILILVYYLIIYYQNFQDKLVKEAELKTLVKESELASLKAQINPHFLFNSLNSISSLTITNPDKAQEMIIKLSEFLRYSIGKNQKEKTTLKSEIKNIQRYLEIEKTRFSERLELNLNIPENCLNKLLPNMILQPLVENSIKHGVYESTDITYINIDCFANWDYLQINIKNNFDPEAVAKKGAGLGLKNIINRLNIIYNRNDLLKINRSENQFEVRLLIPQEKN